MFRMIFTVFVTVVVAYIFLASLSGCSPGRTTTETTTEAENTDSDRARYKGDISPPRVVERAETSTMEHDRSLSGSLTETTSYASTREAHHKLLDS